MRINFFSYFSFQQNVRKKRKQKFTLSISVNDQREKLERKELYLLKRKLWW